MDADRVAALLDLVPLPGEGGRFRRTHGDAHSSAIFYLLTQQDFSALHRLTEVEVYHWYAGSPVRLLLLGPDPGSVQMPILGSDLEAGQRPQCTVPRKCWRGR